MIRLGALLLALVACGDNNRPNRSPTAEQFSLTTQEDLTVMRAINAADLDNDTLEGAIAIPPDHGTATVTGLTLSYQPGPDYHGADQLAVVISDGEAETSLTIDVTVTAVNDPPIGAIESLQTNEDTPLIVDVAVLLDNDSDADVETDGQSIAITTVQAATNGTVALAGNTITFTPTANFNGGGSFTYTLSDGIESSEILVAVVIAAQNDPPVAVDDPGFTTTLNTPITITQAQLLANDTDVDTATLDVTAVNTAVNGTIVDNNDNTYTFTPNLAFLGTATFQYTVFDGIVPDTGLVTITVSL